jgi:hypothetical protein
MAVDSARPELPAARLARIERDIRMLKWLWLLLALGLGLLARFPVAQSYSAQSYVLRNPQGQQVGSLTVDGHGMPAFQLSAPGQDGAIRLQLIPERGASVTLTASNSETSLSAGESPAIRLTTPDQRPWSAP